MNVYEFVFEILKAKAIEILPNEKQKRNLPNKEDIQTTYIPFCDLIYIIERFIHSRIAPRPLEVIYSSQFTPNTISAKAQSNLNRLIKRLKKGEDINSMDYGFLPKSSKEYLKYPFSNDSQYRYTVDFSNQFFGIRHFHLNDQNRSEDVLLYYVVKDEKIYFLSISSHKDMYSKSNVGILINQFPELLEYLGIASSPDMPVGEVPNESVEQIKEKWENGSNVSFLIKNKYYTSINLQTLSRLNYEIIKKYQNIEYQIKHHINDFISHLKAEHPEEKDGFEIIPLNHETGDSVKNGNIYIGNPKYNKARMINLSYLNRLDELAIFGV